MTDTLASLDAQLANARQRVDAVAAALRTEEDRHRGAIKANAYSPGTPLPRSVVDLRRDRDEAHASMKALFRRRVDTLRIVLASRRMDDVIDWNDESAIRGAEDLAYLVAQVDRAETAAGMTAHDVARAVRSMDFAIASCPGASALSARLTALHGRLRDAADFPAERQADATLRRKVRMPLV